MEEDYSIQKPKIGKLEGPNYRAWSIQVRKLLLGQGLWRVVEMGTYRVETPKTTISTTEPSIASGSSIGEDPERTEVKDAKASTIIMGLCEYSTLQHILL